MPARPLVGAEWRASCEKAVAGLGWPGKPSQPAGSSQTGAGGQVHQHTESTQASNLDVGRERGGCRRAEEGVIGLGLRSGGWKKSSLWTPDLVAKHSLPDLQVTPRPDR